MCHTLACTEYGGVLGDLVSVVHVVLSGSVRNVRNVLRGWSRPSPVSLCHVVVLG